MFNHEPKDYQCPMCLLISGEDSEHNHQEDIVYKDKDVLVYVSPQWWINNPGNVLVIPLKHVENIYDISDELLSKLYVVAKKMAIAIRETYDCTGTSTRQHNEPDGNQFVWHFHIHVFPRHKNDQLYKNHENKRWVSLKEKAPYVKKLKEYFAKNH